MLRRPLLLLCLTLVTPVRLAAQAGDKSRPPGRESRDVTLLPNGWRISPAGRHVTVGDLPLAMVQSADGRHVIVSSNGWSKPVLTVVDPKNFYVKSKLTVDHAWLGLAWAPGGKRLYSSGAADNSVREYEFAAGILKPERTFVLSRPNRESFVGGISLTPDGTRLFAVHVLGELLSAIDLPSGRLIRTLSLPAEAYTSLVSADGKTLYVSLWGGARVLVFDVASVELRGEIPVGEHPNAMLLSKDGSRLFVACANTNAIWVVDLKRALPPSRSGSRCTRARPPAARPTPSRSRRTERRCSSRTPTTTTWPSSTCARPAAARCRASSPPAGTRRRCSIPRTARASTS